MIALDQIEQLPFQEKLVLMEALWEGISRSEQDLEMPQWHKSLLDEREMAVTRGEARFTDWDTAKKQIQIAMDQFA